MENSTSSPAPNKPLSSFGVPMAIVLAGGLIALAIYFGGGRSNTVAGVATSGQPTPTAAVPTARPVPTVGAIRPVTTADHIRGAANAKVTIIEYSDLECPFCKRFHPTLQQIMKEYPNDVRWVYRHFPLEQLHAQAKQEAIATECAGEQGKFWELLDKIYEVTTSNDGLPLTDLPKLAGQVGVANIAQFESCLKSDKHNQRIADDLADAAVAGGQGTPYTVVMNASGEKKSISGAQTYDNVKAVVEELKQ